MIPPFFLTLALAGFGNSSPIILDRQCDSGCDLQTMLQDCQNRVKAVQGKIKAIIVPKPSSKVPLKELQPCLNELGRIAEEFKARIQAFGAVDVDVDVCVSLFVAMFTDFLIVVIIAVAYAIEVDACKSLVSGLNLHIFFDLVLETRISLRMKACTLIQADSVLSALLTFCGLKEVVTVFEKASGQSKAVPRNVVLRRGLFSEFPIVGNVLQAATELPFVGNLVSDVAHSLSLLR